MNWEQLQFFSVQMKNIDFISHFQHNSSINPNSANLIFFPLTHRNFRNFLKSYLVMKIEINQVILNTVVIINCSIALIRDTFLKQVTQYDIQQDIDQPLKPLAIFKIISFQKFVIKLDLNHFYSNTN